MGFWIRSALSGPCQPNPRLLGGCFPASMAMVVATATVCAALLGGSPSIAWADARVVMKVGFTLMGDTPESGGSVGGFFARRHPGLRTATGTATAYPRLVVLRALDIDLPPPATPTVVFDNEGYAIKQPLIPVQDGQVVKFRNVLSQPITVDLRDGEDGPVMRSYPVDAGGEATLDLETQSIVGFRVREFAHMRTVLLPVNCPYFEIIHGNSGEARFPKVRPGKYKFATFAAGRWFSGKFRYSIDKGGSYLLEADLTGQLRQLNESLTQVEGGQNRQVRAEADHSGDNFAPPPPPRIIESGDRPRPPPPGTLRDVPRPPPGGSGRPPPPGDTARPPPKGTTPPPSNNKPPPPEEEDELEAGDLKVKTTGPGGIKITPKPK